MTTVATLPLAYNARSVKPPYRLSTFAGRTYQVFLGPDWIERALAEQAERLGLDHA